jgi:hypothetical protein
MTKAAPTMADFRWSPRELPARPVPDSNGWCVRDAYCELLCWPAGSAEWSRFIEYPSPDDLLPLARHLGVSVYDVGIAQHWNGLIGKLDHPGIAMFDIPAAAIGHAVYVPHVHALLHHWDFGGSPRTDLPTFGWPLDPRHLQYNPKLFWVIVDERQPVRP